MLNQNSSLLSLFVAIALVQQGAEMSNETYAELFAPSEGEASYFEQKAQMQAEFTEHSLRMASLAEEWEKPANRVIENEFDLMRSATISYHEHF